MYREARRILRETGEICTVTSSSNTVRCGEPYATYFPEGIDVNVRRFYSPEALKAAMSRAGFRVLMEQTLEFREQISDLNLYRDRALSTLRLISDEAFASGLERLERDFEATPLYRFYGHTLIWGKPQ